MISTLLVLILFQRYSLCALQPPTHITTQAVYKMMSVSIFFIITLLHHTPPVRLHRPTIALQPTIDYLHSLDHSTITLATLQSKLAFLLVVTCFLRPSDLQCIPLASVSVSELSSLSFEVHSPKESVNGITSTRSPFRSRLIQSSVFVWCVPLLCSTNDVLIVKLLLFVNSLQPNKIVKYPNDSLLDSKTNQTVHWWKTSFPMFYCLFLGSSIGYSQRGDCYDGKLVILIHLWESLPSRAFVFLWFYQHPHHQWRSSWRRFKWWCFLRCSWPYIIWFRIKKNIVFLIYFVLWISNSYFIFFIWVSQPILLEFISTFELNS